MDNPLPGLDFSEIINEENDSGSFGDSNILISPQNESRKEILNKLTVQK